MGLAVLNFNKRMDLWLPAYLGSSLTRMRGRARRSAGLTEIMFLVCDHFEPRHAAKDSAQPFERLAAWHSGYAAFQKKCVGEFGHAPLHTWFYPPHHGIEHLGSLADMVFDGLGEVELHYHHRGDTAESLAYNLKVALTQYHRWGHLLTSGDNPVSSWGFIHGDWALNNSCSGEHCGVDDEQTILQNLGCWGDMTMPSSNDCQTRKINSIYYSKATPGRPKAHDGGSDAEVGIRDPEGFFLLQGPLAINWQAPGHPRIENASLTSENWGRPDRIRKWLDCQIHVKGRPEWLFVKLHTHGAIERDFDALFGEKAMAMHRALNRDYNDGKSYRLHYVTARQAYNIAKAAEDGKSGNPDQWRDYRIPPQPHSRYAIDAAHDLICCTAERLSLQNIDSDRDVRFHAKAAPAQEIVGALKSVEISQQRAEITLSARACDTANGTAVAISVADGFRIRQIDGATVTRESNGTSIHHLQVIDERAVIQFQQNA